MRSLESSTIGAWMLICLFVGRLKEVTSTSQSKKPHIIILMADDLGWNDVSYHGSNQIPTPNIDALAYNGVVLSNYYSQPVCTPSRASFLTGKYAIRTGLQGPPLSAGETRALPLNLTLFPKYFHELGYATNLIGKWHVGYYAKEFLPTSRGFDSFFGYYNGYMKYFSYILENISDHFPGYDLHRDVENNCTVDWVPKNIYATDLFTNEAENVIAKHDSNVPLFLFFSHLAPHSSGFAGDLEVRDVKETDESFHYISNPRRRLYAGMVSALDDSVGRVVKALGKKGILNDSIIIFISDNGAMTRASQANEGSNYPYRGQKFALYEGGVHVPAFIWAPMIKNASRIHRGHFHVTDWLPTLYKLAGGDVDDLASIDGIDQSDSIVNGSPSPRDTILLNIDELKDTSGAIKGRFKYLTGVSPWHGAYLGENVDDGDSAAPSYNVTSVTSSLVALALAGAINDSVISEAKILELRRANKVVCAPHSDELLDCTDTCLFDVLADPCEAAEISDQHPEVVRELRETVKNYRKVLLPQQKKGVDPRSLPDYEGGPWLPWLTVDGEPLPRPFPRTNKI
ncbi:arylsulfatase B-like [Venturia canescens]|uniref:arylsulfatase B-like n=1 Tax=Venturia canescens TaxID=32260 RepID=UPI001C9C7DF1|nr:arylsulfatase B-like [Venturia canescens]